MVNVLARSEAASDEFLAAMGSNLLLLGKLLLSCFLSLLIPASAYVWAASAQARPKSPHTSPTAIAEL